MRTEDLETGSFEMIQTHVHLGMTLCFGNTSWKMGCDVWVGFFKMAKVGKGDSSWRGTVHTLPRKYWKEHAEIMESKDPHCDYQIGGDVGVAEGETRELIGFGLWKPLHAINLWFRSYLCRQKGNSGFSIGQCYYMQIFYKAE